MTRAACDGSWAAGAVGAGLFNGTFEVPRRQRLQAGPPAHEPGSGGVPAPSREACTCVDVLCHAPTDMLAWENSGFSIDASVRITLLDRDVPSYSQSLEHLLRYCARPPFALERLSVIRDANGRITKVRYVMPRHKAANWVGSGRSRNSTQPGTNGVVELAPF
jgi:hypothetical protein